MAKAKKVTPKKKGKRTVLANALARNQFVNAFTGGVQGVPPGDVTAAAKHAGLGSTHQSAGNQGHRMLKRPEVTAAIQRRMDIMNVTAERVTKEIARVAFHDVTQVAEVATAWRNGDLSTIDADAAAVIASAKVTHRTEGRGEFRDQIEEVEVRAYDKVAALGLMAKVLRIGGFAGKTIEHVGAGGGPIQVEAQVKFYLPANGRGAQVVEAQVQPALPAPSAVIGPSTVEANHE